MSYLSTVTGCLGKHPFPSYNEALAAVKGKHKKVFIAPYRCSACSMYHVGKHFGNKGVSNRRWRAAKQGE